MFEETSKAAWRLLTPRSVDEPRGWGQLSIGPKALVVFTLGTTAVVLIESVVTGTVESSQKRSVVNGLPLCVGSWWPASEASSRLR